MNNKSIRVALLGNPNSGKTTLFNALVGSHQKVGNFSGVTIEKFEGKIKYQDYQISFIDLPGTYSLTAYSPEEIITRNYIINEKPDVIIDVIDGSNLERNLYLTTQIMELEADVLIALNMYDEVEKQGVKIDIKQLQILLGSHIITTSAVRKKGISSLLEHIIKVYEHKIIIKKNKLAYRAEVEEKIEQILTFIETEKKLNIFNSRWLAIKLLENDQEIYKLIKEYPVWIKIEPLIQKTQIELINKYQRDPEICITEDRYAFISGALQETVQFSKNQKKTFSEKLDSIIINRILGLPIFLGIMWLIFQFTFKLGEAPMAWIETFFSFLASLTAYYLPTGMLKSVIIDGVIGGVGGVLVFLPNILLLFFALAFLEGTGYMARAAFVIDKIMHKVGLHGKSFIPMITGFGCSIPAIMATRTIKNKSDRLVTMMIIPFMSCGAKLPVYVLLISAFFPPNYAGNILFGIYIFGIIIALISAKLLKKTLFKGESEPFVMELPPYRIPTIKSILIEAGMKAIMYLKKAGTTILLASLIIWGISTFPQNKLLETKYRNEIKLISVNQDLKNIEKEKLIANLESQNSSQQLEYSIAGRLGKTIEPIIKPLGFDWRIGIALITGLAAKEVVVSTLGTIYAVGESDNSTQDLAARLRHDPGFSQATALSLMVFVLLYVPCLASIAVFKKEAGAWKWVLIYSFYALTIAWIMAFLVYTFFTSHG